MSKGQANLKNKLESTRMKIVRGSITDGKTQLNAGDRKGSIGGRGPKPDDLIFTLDNSAGGAAKWYQIGGALPNHVDAFGEAITGTLGLNFGLTNDDIIDYIQLGMGWAFGKLEREVEDSATSYQDMPFHVVTGIYNREKDPDISQNLNSKSSMDQDRKVSNIMFEEGEELMLDAWHTWFIKVPAGEKLIMTGRVRRGDNFPVEVKVAG